MKDQYFKDGYLIKRQLLAREKIDSIVEEFNIIVKDRLSTHSLDVKDELWCNLKLLFDLNINDYLSVITLFPKLCSVNSLFLEPNLQDVIDILGIKGKVFQTTPVFHIMSENLKISGGYFGFGAHQDWTSLQSSLNNITVWIPLTDVSKKNYTLEIAPGSHLDGLLLGEQDKNYYEPSASIVEKYKFEYVDAQIGDVVLFSNFLLHKSSIEYEGEQFRMAVSHRYEDYREETFIKRGYPFTQKKVIERRALNSDFPSREDIIKQFKASN